MKEKTYEKKTTVKNGVIKLAFFAVAILLEFIFLWGIFYTSLENYVSLITVANKVLALVLVVAIYSQKCGVRPHSGEPGRAEVMKRHHV